MPASSFLILIFMFSQLVAYDVKRFQPSIPDFVVSISIDIWLGRDLLSLSSYPFEVGYVLVVCSQVEYYMSLH